MAIASPINSFVDFNDPNLDCRGNARDVALPVYDNFGIKFQIQIIDEKRPKTSLLYAAACSEECAVLYNPDLPVIATCDRYVLQNVGDGTALVAADFPVTVLNTTDYIAAGVYDLPTFLASLKLQDDQIQALDYISCCLPVTTDLEIPLTTSTSAPYTISIGVYWGYGYVVFPEEDISAYVGFNECFRYCILDAADTPLACSNLFYRISDPCLTTIFTYYNEENGYDFKYSFITDAEGDMQMTENQIRLFVYFDKPIRPVEENVFRRSDKVQQRLSTLIEKEWLGHTSYLSDDQHDKFIVMLKHDVLHVLHENRNMDRRMTQIGDVDYQYPDINNPKTAPASFRIKDYIHSYVNNNCGFNCGIEIIDPCEDGGNVPQCPEKYSVEFEVGAPGAPMGAGDTVFTSAELSQAQGVEVYREGLLQHSSGPNNVVFVRGVTPALPATITFTPEVTDGERIAVWEV